MASADHLLNRNTVTDVQESSKASSHSVIREHVPQFKYIQVFFYYAEKLHTLLLFRLDDVVHKMYDYRRITFIIMIGGFDFVRL